jgi:hypothetical protein
LDSELQDDYSEAMKPKRNQAMRFSGYVLVCVTLLLVAGCKSIGPGTITRDRFNYSGALADSWKTQMLLNLVKQRYLDLPIYLDVGQIVSGYTLETGISFSGQLAKENAGDQYLGMGAQGTYTDRPTITYSPLTGEKFLQSFLTPIQPVKVMSLVQSGYPADFILQLTVDSLNGLRNRPVSLGSKRKADPEFFRVLTLLREIQDAGAVGMRIDQPTNSEPAAVLFFRGERTEPEVLAKMAEVRKLLGFQEGDSAFHLVRSPLRGRPGELSIDTRSLLQVLASLSRGVDVPPQHLQRKLTPPLPDKSADEFSLLHVYSGPAKPAGAFVAVPYEGAWFWIANDDWKSKRTFSSILFLFTLVNAGGAQALPTITIPAQ